MLVERSRSVGALPPSVSPPVGHHHPADLSPRSSSNSSLLSSNESLLNTSLSVPSPPTAKENGNSPGRDYSALQRLQYALESDTMFTNYFNETDNEHLKQQLGKGFPLSSSVGMLITSPKMKAHHSDEDMPKDDHDDDDHAPSPSAGVVMGVPSPSGSPTSLIDPNLVSTIFQCPLCCVVCSSRHDFNEHLVTHSQQHACPKCDFITNIEEEFRDHLQEIHGVDDSLEILSDDEVKTPKTNAQGKLKTFKCKHCEHRSVTKKEFWDHTKSHIRNEKMLHCPKCPFVTEYKHHLEYHLRNHMGSKPYQCTKCSYSCVNKSMLNSHLKSHSNVYQYRCTDCSYATKYCHSLKLHLRKYNHNPAMVLNPDGTPNPLPIIDVYGTRRGPKMKRPDPTLEGLATIQPIVSTPSKPAKMLKKSTTTPVKKSRSDKSSRQLEQKHMSPKPTGSPRFMNGMLSNQAVTPPLKKLKEESSGDSDSEGRILSHSHHMHSKLPQLPQAPISPSSIGLILQRSNGLDQPRKEMSPIRHPLSNPIDLASYAAQLNQYFLNPMLHMAAAAPLNELAQMAATEQQTKLLAQLLQCQTGLLPPQLPQQITNNLASRASVVSHSMGHDTNGVAPSPLDLTKNDEILNGGDGSNKRKRKGKALRYERRYSDEDDDEDEALDFSNNNNNAYQENRERKRHCEPTDLSISPSLMCKYCEISFPDHELYNIHMNFHSGDMDPFLCRSCGKKTRDKVAFFKHLTTDPH